MTNSPQQLNARLKNSKTLSELRNQANEHALIISAVHDSVICVVSLVVVLVQQMKDYEMSVESFIY